jgi:hypothetical protein
MSQQAKPREWWLDPVQEDGAVWSTVFYEKPDFECTHVVEATPRQLHADAAWECVKQVVSELKKDELRLVNSSRPGDQSLGATIAWCRSHCEAALKLARGEGEGE